MSQNVSQKLRILSLHGYTQCAEKFKEKTYPFQRKVKKYAEFIFITGPHEAPNEFSNEDNINKLNSKVENHSDGNVDDIKTKDDAVRDENKTEKVENSDIMDSYAWYLRKLNDNGEGYIYEGLQETLNYLERVFDEQGPFDGIFGFSQGGCVVGLLCDLQQRKLTQHVKFDFAIMASAFKHETGEYYQKKLTIPTLHIYGENDKQITSDMSRALIECFENPVVARHSGGHYIPGNNSLKSEYELFFREQWSRKFEENEKP